MDSRRYGGGMIELARRRMYNQEIPIRGISVAKTLVTDIPVSSSEFRLELDIQMPNVNYPNFFSITDGTSWRQGKTLTVACQYAASNCALGYHINNSYLFTPNSYNFTSRASYIFTWEIYRNGSKIGDMTSLRQNFKDGCYLTLARLADTIIYSGKLYVDNAIVADLVPIRIGHDVYFKNKITNKLYQCEGGIEV